MKDQILPAGYVADTTDVYLASSRRGASRIYLALLAAVAGAGIALPLTRIALTVQARGSVRPAIERHEVVAPEGGIVEQVRASRGALVRAGDTLLVLDQAPIRARAELLREQIDRRRRELEDLGKLVRPMRAGEPPTLETSRLGAAYAQHAGELHANLLRQEEVSKRQSRAAALAERNLLPLSELEGLRAEVELLQSDADLLVRRRRAEWRAEEVVLREELESLILEARLNAEEGGRLVIRAPAAGTLEELVSVSPRSYLAPGARVGTISPASPFVAEVWIAPTTVGLLREGDRARLQVDAFDYNEWGTIPGVLTEVSHDFVLVAEQPFFRGRVTLDRTTVVLANGSVGRLRKGMTLTARFQVADRSLWQLLWDRLEDWIDPRRPSSA